MIFWSGAGILVLFIIGGILFLTQAIVDGLFGSGFYSAHGWLKLVALWLAAVPLWPYGQWLNRDVGQARELIDPQTQERVSVSTGGECHSFFFVPVQYWAVLCLVLGVIALFL